MSLMGAVVTLFLLCWLLVASSSKSVSRNPMQSGPEDTAPIGNNQSTSLDSSGTGQRNVSDSSLLLDTTGLNLQSHDGDFNQSQNRLLDPTTNDGKASPDTKSNDSNSTPPPAQGNYSTTGPVAGVPSKASPANVLANTIRTTLVTTTAAIATATSLNTTATSLSTTATSLTTTSTATSSTSTNTTTSPTNSPMSTAEKTSAHTLTTIAPAPNIVKETTISTSLKTTATMLMKPETTSTTTTITTTTAADTTTTTATTAATAAAATAATTAAASTVFVSANSSSTAQHRVVDVAGHDLTRELVDKASLLAILLFGLLFFFVVVAVFVTQAYESYKRKDYTQVDYLINGMYTDSGV